MTKSTDRNIALTIRELEVLNLISEGKSSKEVGDRLCVSKKTVDYHLAKIYLKLQASNRIEALRRAWELGIVSDNPQLLS